MVGNDDSISTLSHRLADHECFWLENDTLKRDVISAAKQLVEEVDNRLKDLAIISDKGQ